MARESLRSFEKAIAEWLETVPAEEAATLAQRPSSTIVPAPAADTGGKRALAVLERLAGGATALQSVQTLGQGGMGVVRLAEQVALGRMVAVKTLRPDRQADGAALDLLREAWVTGALEHPNVVPVYDISLDEQGNPQIVLKRISGHAWSELINDAERVAELFDTEDLLAWNLDILGQVLNAVRFAHSRGIIHRDLKPDNVMIGDFGEVYVLDWGIALSLRDDGSGRLPLASAARDMAGTPVYMAPEMLGGQTGVPLSERTDIYLCGSMLYEVLAGKAPHDGDTALAVVSSVVKSCPELPDDAPAELVRIVRRAMDPDPDGRFENAEQLRLALRGYLQHRGSERLAAHAEQRVVELEAVATAADAAGRRQELYKLFGAARFGFHEALAGWRGNQAARAGLRRAGEIMVGYELAHGDPRAAAAQLAEVDEPPPELAARVAAAVRAAEQRRSELESLAQDHDVRIGTRTRTFLSLLLGLMFTAFPLAAASSGGTIALRTPRQIALWSAGFLVLLGAFALWARESMTRTVFNRRLMASIMFLFVAQVVMATGAELLGMDALTVNVLMLFLWFGMAGMSTITIEPRMWPTTVGYLLAFLAAARWPEHRHYLMAGSNFVLTVNAVWIWRPRPLFRTPEERAAFRARRRARRPSL